MQRYIHSTKDISPIAAHVQIFGHTDQISSFGLSDSEKQFARDFFQRKEADFLMITHYPKLQFFLKKDNGADTGKSLEKLRIAGDQIVAELNKLHFEEVVIISDEPADALAAAEGMALGNYQFKKYMDPAKSKPNSLTKIGILHADKAKVEKRNIIIDAVYNTRDLVNEPLNGLNAGQLAERLDSYASSKGVTVEIMGRKKIESLKMGGLLSVNRGSVDPPSFTVMEWKPADAINKKPVVLVGKGVVYDTGGMNLKTGSYMDDMKMDMGGAALMGSTISAAAAAKLPLWIVALIPATDNRCNGNAYVPGDIIRMYNGMSVEIMNTDAEGRLILADAISYAEKYHPELVITAATLTGSAMRAVGKHALVAMGSKCDAQMHKLKKAGDKVYERVAELPFYDEYAEELKSPIADLKNLGGPEGGAITAGKFLEKFTTKPFIHLDIAGVAFTSKKYQYRGQGGTGFGLRLLMEFLSDLTKNQ